MMQLVAVGLSHKTAPLEIRERLAFSGDGLELALQALRRQPDLREVVMVCTCNRTEVYALCSSPEPAVQGIVDWMKERSAADLSKHIYTHMGRDGLEHLFRVAASLDSMVVGEPQILGQVKQAFANAQKAHSAGPRIERIFSRAFQSAKKVRNQTGVGEAAVSMSFVAVELAKKIFNTLKDRRVLLVGAGEMCELAAQHMKSAGAAEVLVANRSFDKAKRLAEAFEGRAFGLSELDQLLTEVDIVLSSTAAPGYLITREMMAKAVKARRFRPLLAIDLAVPRDIDPAVSEVANVYSYDVDDMQRVVHDNLKTRQGEAERAERLVRQEVAAYLEDEREREVLPVVAAFRHRADSIAALEAERAIRILKHHALPSEAEEHIRALAHSVISQLLHQPTVMLRSSAATDAGKELAGSVVSLFGLDIDAITLEISEEKAKRRELREAALIRAESESTHAKDPPKRPNRILRSEEPQGQTHEAAMDQALENLKDSAVVPRSERDLAEDLPEHPQSQPPHDPASADSPHEEDAKVFSLLGERSRRGQKGKP